MTRSSNCTIAVQAWREHLREMRLRFATNARAFDEALLTSEDLLAFQRRAANSYLTVVQAGDRLARIGAAIRARETPQPGEGETT